MASNQLLREGRWNAVKVVGLENENAITIFEHSSKGNQLKWQKDGVWYKADYFGYESLAETICSYLLAHSNVKRYVSYRPVWLKYDGEMIRGCESSSFLEKGVELISLERLIRLYTGLSVSKSMVSYRDAKDRIAYVVELVTNITGLESFGGYLATMLAVDAFFLNEDRHTNNISFLYDTKTKEYALCPIYDMGMAVMSDEKDSYPIGEDVSLLRKKIKAKPFSVSFDEQLDAVEELYGNGFRFPVSKQKLKKKLEEKLSELAELEMYSKQELERVYRVLEYQMEKYQYFFENSV